MSQMRDIVSHFDIARNTVCLGVIANISDLEINLEQTLLQAMGGGSATWLEEK